MATDPLVDLALRPWGRPAVGVVQHRTVERLVELQPSFPVPGPSHVCLVRCAPERAEAMIDETRAFIRGHGLPFMWALDEGTEPADFGRRLAARGIPEVDLVHCMVLSVGAEVDPGAAPVEIVDALRDEATFRAAEEVQAAAFGSPVTPGQHDRFEEGRTDAVRHFLLALLDGRPVGAGWATVHEAGVLMNGGAVDPAFQGRGVYRALVAARLALARRAGVAGLVTLARPDTSEPILAAFGFRAVGTIRMHPDG